MNCSQLIAGFDGGSGGREGDAAGGSDGGGIAGGWLAIGVLTG